MCERIVAVLAQAPEPGGGHKYGEGDVFFWGAVLIGLVTVGSVIIMFLRRRLKAGASPVQGAGFSLSELRAMRDRGEITPEEYEQTRTRVIAAVKKESREYPKPKRGPADAPPDSQP